MFKFLSLECDSFGLDISDLSLKVMDLDKNKSLLSRQPRIVLNTYLEEEIEPGIIKEGEIKKKKLLSKIIKKAVLEGKRKIRKKYITFSLPEEKSFLRVIQLPWMKDEKAIKKAASFEVENYIPLKLEEVYVDAQVLSSSENNKDKVDVLIAASPKKLVDSYVEVIKMAGFSPKATEIESLSIARALLEKDKVYPSLFILDFGATRTSLNIFSKRSIRFTTTIPISSLSLTKIISEKLNVPLKRAEIFKIKYGLKPLKEMRLKEKTGDNFFEKEIVRKRGLSLILEPYLMNLVREIKKHIDYYLDHIQSELAASEGQKIEKIILCGGGSNLKGLPEFLEKETGIPVVLGNPWINFDSFLKKPPLSQEKSLSFTTAIGLAMRDLLKNND